MTEQQASRLPHAALADYDLVAAEYYDPVRHPTCANFGELSERFLAERILQSAPAGSRILEVGAGRSIVAPVLARAGRALASLTLLDESAAMLAYSQAWRSHGATLIVANASATSLGAASWDLIVASLCDPYNRPAFWAEMARLLSPGGRCLATLPAHEWVSRFRRGAHLDEADFVLANGRVVAVPSFVPSPEGQSAMIAAAGLRVIETVTFSATDLRGPHSPKLEVFGHAVAGPVLRGITMTLADAP